MSSQLDLDQGGTFRQTQRVYLGPTLGWVEVQDQWLLNVTVGGTTIIQRGTNMILVAFNGLVTVALPPAKASNVALPKQFAIVPVVVADNAGFAGSQTITITPGDGLIDGLASIPINSNYGVRVLRPDVINGGYTLLQ